MRQVFMLILAFMLYNAVNAQGITLLNKGGSNWNDATNWVQINTPVGQTPIQRVPTELDDIVFSSTQSGMANVSIFFPNISETITIGGNSTTGNRCRSMRVSNTNLSLVVNTTYSLSLNVNTTNGGKVIIDSNSNFRYGHFTLSGGNNAINDLEINNSSFGSLFSHEDWSTITLLANGKGRFVNSTMGGHFFGSNSGGNIYAENSSFRTTRFTLGDNAVATLLNTNFQNDMNNLSMTFQIGKDANFISSNVNVTSNAFLDFFTSGSVLKGNVAVLMESDNSFNFRQKYPGNPLPNIIDGNLSFNQGTMGISGDVKISGNLINNAPEPLIYPDLSDITINGQYIFTIGGIKNYGTNAFITSCVQNYCNFKLEFFGSGNSTIHWPMGFPIDTLIINKTGCAKVFSSNSLYVSGQARIMSGQLVLNPNAGIPYKFVCAGDLNIYQGGGLFLRRNTSGVVANMAVDGSINDYNTSADSTCQGLSNPYGGDILLYRRLAGTWNYHLNIQSGANMGNLKFSGSGGSNFNLASNLFAESIDLNHNNKVVLGNHSLTVNNNLDNYGINAFVVTNGTGKLQLNNVGAAQKVYPIGPTLISYNPLKLTNTGTQDNFKVNVKPTVLTGGTTGNAYTEKAVNRTWDVEETNPGQSIVAMEVQWNAADEMPGFLRNAAYLSHYISGTWNPGNQTSASGSNPYTLTRSNISSFSPFAVLGEGIVLPVSLITFSGSHESTFIRLKWSTAQEINCSHFILERSLDNLIFEQVTSMNAIGNSQVITSYQFDDKFYQAGTNYYRLKIVDKDGQVTISEIIPVTAPAEMKVLIFPNPVKEKLFIRGGNPVRATVLDASGRALKRFQLNQQSQINFVEIHDLPAGQYFIRLINSSKIVTYSFIKE